MKSLLNLIIAALLFLSTTNHANPDSAEIPMVSTIENLKEVAKKINEITDRRSKINSHEQQQENVHDAEIHYSDLYVFLNLYHDCLVGYQKFLKAKKQQDKFAYLATGALAANMMLLPWDALMQVFQYFCLQEHCAYGTTFIKRTIDNTAINACFNNGFIAECAKKAASYQTSFYLYFKEGCASNVPHELINQVIPSQNPVSHMVSSCNLEVALIPSSIEMICIASNIVFGCGFMGTYLNSKWQENTVSHNEAAFLALNFLTLAENERNALPPDVKKAYDNALIFYNFLSGDRDICNLALIQRANSRRGTSCFTKCFQKIKIYLGFAQNF